MTKQSGGRRRHATRRVSRKGRKSVRRSKRVGRKTRRTRRRHRGGMPSLTSSQQTQLQNAYKDYGGSRLSGVGNGSQ